MELTAGEMDFIIAGAFHPNTPAVRLDDAFGKRQSQSRTAAFEARFAGGMLAHIAWLVELGEDDLTEIRIHAHARIADNDLHAAIGQVNQVRDDAAGDADLSFIWGEFDGIGGQVMN